MGLKVTLLMPVEQQNFRRVSVKKPGEKLMQLVSRRAAFDSQMLVALQLSYFLPMVHGSRA